MKYSQLKGQPNILGSRRESIAPSLSMDSRSFPHIAWLEKGQGINTINYLYWDGLKWSYNGTSKVYISQEDILFSPDSLILDNDNPYIVFARKIAVGSRLSLAYYSSEWIFNDLDVNYEVGWIGVVSNEINIDHSSSSSSQSSNIEADHYIIVYDSTNAQFRVYNATNGWVEFDSLSAVLDDFSRVKISICGQSYVGISYVFDSNVIKYNFVNSLGWAFPNFLSMSASQLYGDIIDMDLKGYSANGKFYIIFGWLSRTVDTFYICSQSCSYDPLSPLITVELPADGINTVVESNDIDVTSPNYIINGYGKIGLCLKGERPRMVVNGASSKIFTLDGTWSNDLIDISGISNGIVTDYLDVVYSNDDSVKISITADSGNIYYFESDNTATFPVSTPNMVLLSEEWAFNTYFYPDILVGQDIGGAYNNLMGGILKDAKMPLLITSNHTPPPITTTTTTTTGVGCFVITYRDALYQSSIVASNAEGDRLVARTPVGIIISSDYGSNWTTTFPGVNNWKSIASSADGSIVVACVQGGYIYVSSDYGASWSPRASSNIWQGVTCSSDGSIMAAVAGVSGIYISSDYGNSWIQRSTLSGSVITSSSDGSKLFTIAYDPVTGLDDLYTSSDYGITWVPRFRASGYSNSWGTGCVASSSDGSKLVAFPNQFAYSKAYRSFDSGLTWYPMSLYYPYITYDHNIPHYHPPESLVDNTTAWNGVASSSDGNKLAACSFNDLFFTSDNAGVTWTAQTNKLQTWMTCASNADGSRLIAGMYLYAMPGDDKGCTIQRIC